MMRRRWAPASGLAAVLLAGLLVACGGGGGAGDEAEVITDPARVPTSTPIGEAAKYEIRGGVVSLPSGSATPGEPGEVPTASPLSYVVQSGDNCSSIAEAHGITSEALREANPSINEGCTNLIAGETLTIPGSTPEPGSTPQPATTPTPAGPTDSGQTYTVQSGDTCYDIALSYNVSVDDIIALNDLDSACSLSVGQVVKIP